MSADEFSQRPFAVGSLTGVRSFRVTADGVLTGVVQREPWAPDVNEAICHKPFNGLAAAMSRMAASGADAMWAMSDAFCRMSGRVNLCKRPKVKPATPTPEPAPHQAGTLDCSCGFYAYFDEGHNPHHSAGNVLGIVEGFGVCTTGTRGFRSSKARIRALILDGDHAAVRANYPDAAIYPTLNAALAEFPLTPVEGARKPLVGIVTLGAGSTITTSGVTYTFTADTRAFDEALRNVLRAYQPKRKPKRVTDETPQARALRLRRGRNTGPSDRRGIDGHYRRGAAE